MKRWQVIFGPIRHKGRTYLPGELMPEDFTEKDRYRNGFSRRLVQVDIPDEPLAVPQSPMQEQSAPAQVQDTPKQEAPKPIPKQEATPIKGSSQAAKQNTTGAKSSQVKPTLKK